MKKKIYYITGISGSGKSEVKAELRQRGYIAFDADEDGITTWRERETGAFVSHGDRKPGPDGSFIKQYDWHMSGKRIEELVGACTTDTVFICGIAANRYELWGMFDAVFCLSIDSETLVHRIKTRTNNDYGKDPAELEAIIGWHKRSEQIDSAAGAILIDAMRPAREVADEILSLVAESRPHELRAQASR